MLLIKGLKTNTVFCQTVCNYSFYSPKCFHFLIEIFRFLVYLYLCVLVLLQKSPYFCFFVKGFFSLRMYHVAFSHPPYAIWKCQSFNWFFFDFCPKDSMSSAKPARDFSVMAWQYLSPKYWLMKRSVDGNLKSMWVLQLEFRYHHYFSDDI